MRSVQFIDVEHQPTDYTGRMLDEYETESQVVNAEIRLIVDNPDDCRCQVCKAPIGFILVGDEDSITWRFMTVVFDGAQAWSVCEDCSMVLDPDW